MTMTMTKTNIQPRFTLMAALAAFTSCAVAAVLAAAPTPAQAQTWGWVDKNGSKQFSDQPPPADIPKDKIFKSPRGAVIDRGNPQYGGTVVPDKAATPAAGAQATKAPATSASAPAGAASKPKTPEEQFQERQKAKAKADEEAQKQAQADTKQKQDCERARGYLRTLDEGVRIAQTDKDGNRSVLNDEQRASEKRRAQEAVSANCK
jgi:hypothetical protein